MNFNFTWPFKFWKDKKKFEHLKKICQVGDCILIHHLEPDFIADGIRWFENGKVSHTAMVVDQQTLDIAEFTEKGAGIGNIEEYTQVTTEITVRRIIGLTPEQAYKMKEAGINDAKSKTGYDFFAYLGYMWINLLRKVGIKKDYRLNPTDVKGLETCSSGYIKWCEAAGLDLFPGYTRQSLTPQHLYATNKLVTIEVV